MIKLINALNLIQNVTELHVCVLLMSKQMFNGSLVCFFCILKPICFHSNSIVCSILLVQVARFSMFPFGNVFICVWQHWVHYSCSYKKSVLVTCVGQAKREVRIALLIYFHILSRDAENDLLFHKLKN